MDAQITPEKLQKLKLPQDSNVLELSKSGKVLIIFLRIFACPYCRKAVNDVNEIVQSLRQLKISVVFVHQGPEKMAREVFETYGPRLVRSTEAASHPDRFPFYEIVDEEREYYRLFNLPLFDWNNFQKKEKPTWHQAIDRWGTCDWVGEVKQLGALFVIDRNGSVFSSMLQKGQTNIHDLAEFLNIPMDVRFLPDHSKSIMYRVQTKNSPQSKGQSTSQGSSSLSNEKGELNNNQKNESPALKMQLNSTVQLREKYKEYRNFCLKALEDQKQYARTKWQSFSEGEDNKSNDEENKQQEKESKKTSDLNDKDLDLPQRIIKSSRLASLLRCMPGTDERPYTEEELKDVVKNWKLDNVLEDNQIRQFFRVFLTKDLSVENILFYESVQDLLDALNQFTESGAESESSAQEIADGVEAMIQEFLSSSSDNMVNVGGAIVNKFNAFTSPAKVTESSEELKKYLHEAIDEVKLNMTDPLQRFRWSIEGQRAAAYTIVQD